MRSEWEEKRIADIGEVKGGATPRTTVKEYYGGNIPWITPKDLSATRCKYINRGERNITQAGFESTSVHLLPKGSVLFSSRAPIGYIAIAGVDVTTNQGFKSVVPKQDKVISEFLYYLLHYSKRRIIELGSGTTFKEVSAKVMKNVLIEVPSLPTQKAIADTLSCLDAKIEVNNKIIKNLEQQAQAIFKSWFIDFEPFQDGKFIESELGPIPEGWELLRFGEFIAPRNERGNNSGVPTYSVTNTGLRLRRDIFKRRLSSSETKNKVLYKGDLVFGMSRDILNWGIMKDRIGEVSSAYHVYEINQEVINSWYVELFVDQQIHYYSNLIRPASREGQGVDRGLLPTKYIYIPPIGWVDRYLDVTGPIKEGQKISQQQNTTLAALRDTLLPKLMSGEIEVPVE